MVDTEHSGEAGERRLVLRSFGNPVENEIIWGIGRGVLQSEALTREEYEWRVWNGNEELVEFAKDLYRLISKQSGDRPPQAGRFRWEVRWDRQILVISYKPGWRGYRDILRIRLDAYGDYSSINYLDRDYLLYLPMLKDLLAERLDKDSIEAEEAEANESQWRERYKDMIDSLMEVL